MREALLAAGARQFCEHGVSAVSVETLLSDADVSRATFYEFFKNKYNLLDSILNPLFEMATARFEALAAVPAEAALSGLFETYLDLWRQHAEGLQLIGRIDSVVFERFAAQHRALNEALLIVLSGAERQGLLRSGSAELSLRVIARTAIPLLRVFAEYPAGDALFRDAMRSLLVRGH